jgi:hypothetical protein
MSSTPTIARKPNVSSPAIPSTKAGLFGKVTITRWRKAFFDKERFV